MKKAPQKLLSRRPLRCFAVAVRGDIPDWLSCALFWGRRDKSFLRSFFSKKRPPRARRRPPDKSKFTAPKSIKICEKPIVYCDIDKVFLDYWEVFCYDIGDRI